MVPNRRTEEKEREGGVEFQLFLSFSLRFLGSEPYALFSPTLIGFRLVFQLQNLF